MTTVRKPAILLGLILLATSCASDAQYNAAILKLDDAWKHENDRTLAKLGGGAMRSIRRAASRAATKARRIGLVAERQNLETGYLFLTASAPTPLTMAEWKQVQTTDTPEMRSLIAEEVGLLSWFATLDPSAKDVLVNVYVTARENGSELAIGLRLRD